VRLKTQYLLVLAEISNSNTKNIQTTGIEDTQCQFRITDFNIYIQTGCKSLMQQQHGLPSSDHIMFHFDLANIDVITSILIIDCNRALVDYAMWKIEIFGLPL
jgi:hypothetical protein